VSNRRFDVVELLAIAAFVAFSVGLFVYFAPARKTEVRVITNVIPSGEGQRLAAAYGPDKYSFGLEEWIIRELLHGQREGVFLDVGSADARELNNTYYLESALGWSGIAIDAQPEYAASYARYRPRTRFRSFLISDRSDTLLPFYLTPQKATSSANPGWAHATAEGGNVKTVSVPAITLDDLLARESIDQLDLMSMDVEGHEPQALAGFSIDRLRPKVVVVEAHGDGRQAILDYFTAHGYSLQARYLDADEFNFYFIPLATSREAQ
jgi:FkbM family methyltransferase